MSSKSRAASLFNSEMLLENRLIVLLQNVGTCLKLYRIMLLSYRHVPKGWDTHRRSSSLIRALSTALSIRRRCINRALQTPSSNSCMRSTTNMRNKLKPSGESRRENAFYNQYQLLNQRHGSAETYRCRY